MELKNAKYQFRVENTEYKIPNLRYIGLFSQSIVFKTRIVKRCSFYMRLKLSQLRSILIFIPLGNIGNHTFFMFSGGIKRNIDPKWVKQLQYRREWHNLMLFTWNASSSIVKQNDCKNKTTWLTQTALPKYLYLFHATYIEDIKEFFKGFFFLSKFVLY